MMSKSWVTILIVLICAVVCLVFFNPAVSHNRSNVRRISRPKGIIAPGATLLEISTREFTFTEGPATADAAGNVYFTDQPNNRIMIYTVDGPD